jgi:hypothetical protein
LTKQYERGFREGLAEGQKNMQNAGFLIKGDKLITGREDVMNLGNGLLEEAKSHIKIITVTGAAWMVDKTKEIIEKKIKKGVKVQLILVDPTSPIADYISSMESEFTVVPRPAERVFGDSLKINVKKVVDIYGSIIGCENIRLYGKPFFWKGSIVDGQKVMYTMFDVPRHDTPLRLNNDRRVAKHFEKFYFDEIWSVSKSIQKTR